MVRLAFSGLVVSLALSVGCGGGAPNPVSVPPSRGESAAVLAAGPLTPVAAPPGVFAVARIQNPAKVADTSVAWSALPIDWRGLLAKEAPGLVDAVDMDSSLDFVSMLDPGAGMEPRVLWAFSFGARSADAVAGFFRGNGAKVVEESRGAYRIQIGSELVCRAARARGRSPARVVCSSDAEGAMALSPYMTRGLPEESFGTAAVHARVLAEPFRKRYGAQLPLLRTVGVPFVLREISVDDPKLDRALRDVAYATADELVALARDVGRVDLDLSFSGEGDAIDAGLALGFVGQASWAAGNVARAAARPAAPAPESFFRLPLDAVGAGYSSFADPERVRSVAAGLAKLADAYLEYLKVPEVRRALLTRALEATLTSGGRSIYATMNVAPAPAGKGAPESEKVRATMRAAIGSHLFAIEGAGTGIGDLASELVKGLTDRALRARLATLYSLTEDRIPTARQWAVRGKGIPAGTRAFELQIPATLIDPEPEVLGSEEPRPAGKPAPKKAAPKKPPPKKKTPPFGVLLVVAPDGPTTWIAMGTDEKSLTARLAAARSGEGPVLATRAGLDALRTEAALSGGFATLAASLAGLSTEELGAPALDRLPSRGETPMVWKVRADPAGPRVVMTSRIPRAVVEDVVAWMGSLAGSFIPTK